MPWLSAPIPVSPGKRGDPFKQCLMCQNEHPALLLEISWKPVQSRMLKPHAPDVYLAGLPKESTAVLPGPGMVHARGTCGILLLLSRIRAKDNLPFGKGRRQSVGWERN